MNYGELLIVIQPLDSYHVTELFEDIFQMEGEMRTCMYSFVAGLIAAMFVGCKDDDSVQVANGNQGQLRMYMTDAPSSFDAVNVVITRVEVRKASPDTGWTTINSSSNTYNVITLRNGSMAVVGSASLSAGTYSQIRVWFGSSSNVVVGGVPLTLGLSSNIQGGLILNHQMNVQANVTYEVTLDFDIGQSIVASGVGQFTLNPVFRVQSNESAGNISGRVQPPNSHVTVWTVAGGDTVAAVADTVSGSFQLVAVPQGSYAIQFSPSRPTFRDTSMAGVTVNARQTTNIGVVTIPG